MTGPVAGVVGALVLVVVVVALVLGAPAGGALPPTRPGSAAAADAASSAVPSASAGASAAPDSALAVLAGLPVKGRAPLTGYARTADFGPAWLDVDRNGCDTRDDVLHRDLTRISGSRCTVRSGVLADPYTGRTIDFVRGATTSEAVQIDHVVALADAWQTGAQRLSAARRVALANDPINLFAVDGPTNQQKGAGDAATWLPPNRSFRCTYVAHQVGVKRTYGLWVTAAERAAMERVLTACPTTPAPVSALSAAAAGGAAAPSATGSTAAAATPAPGPDDPRYASCAAAKAAGAHTPYLRGRDPEYAWYSDGDGDGRACE
jgi:hypothetical protein